MKILLVDSDTAVIQTLLPLLKTLPGHEVRVGLGGEKALENAAVFGEIGLLITEVVMEPMNGFVLRDEMRERHPAVRTIFMSGYDLSDYAAQTEGHQVLQKPVTPEALLAAVEAELAQIAAKPAALPPPTALAKPMAAMPQVPRARPVAVAKAVPAAAPKAVPVATPKAVPVATPKASPAAKAVPAATPKAVPSAAPKVAPVAAPAQPGTAAPVLSAAITPVMSAPDEFVGRTIGAYQILHRLGDSQWGAVYSAVQIAINRPVGLKVLDAARSEDPATRERFIADARAKANVQHPAILAVYEAGEIDGLIFYAHEFADGQNLAQLAAAGQKVTEPTALKILRVAAEGLAHLHQHKISHITLDAGHVYLGGDGHVRLANIAAQFADQQASIDHEIVVLGRAMFAIIHTGPQLSQGLRTLLGRMVQAPGSGLIAWEQVLAAVKALEPKVVPVEAAKIGAQDRAAIAAVEAARRQQRKSVIQYVVGSVLLIVVGGWFVWHVLRSNEHVVEAMVAIPAGTYTVGSQKVTLPAFWIDKYEVTVGQYAKFLEALEKNPSSSKDFDHPKQPRYLEGHTPPNWAIFYGQARRNGAVRSAPYSLDSPMVEVTWWDAYAYARWRGRELPTEEQWEAAARGGEGFVYPWGNDLDPKKVNSGADHNPDPRVKGAIDGWNFWSPVDAILGDKSPFGAIGMSGNVSEWVGTASADGRFRIVKGGNFMSKDARLDQRVTEQDPNKGQEHIGFRTVSNTPPPSSK